MDRKERYFNFIVNDMMSKTHIDDVNVTLPFGSVIGIRAIQSYFLNAYRKITEVFDGYGGLFYEHFTDTYGVLHDEIGIVQDMYVEKLLNHIIKRFSW